MLNVDVIIGGHRFTGWKQVTIQKSMETLAGSFNLTSIDKWELGEWELIPGSEVKISLNNKRIITGHIDRVQPNIGPEQHELKIIGRDRTADLVDCSAITTSNNPGSWKNINFETFVKSVTAPFGTFVIKDFTSTDKRENFSLQSNESVAAVLQRYANKRGLLLLSDPQGDLIITETGRESSVDNLEYGINIKSANADYDFTNRFSEYRVKGQEKKEGSPWSKSTIGVFGSATDEAITRYRPLQLSAEGSATNATARKRAEWEASIRAGKSSVITTMLQGWQQSNGELWLINRLVTVDIEKLQVKNAKMIISSAEYTLSDSGSGTKLILKREDTFKPKPTVNKKKAVSVWERL